ncbi:hypothetical protein FSARC_10904 [Fusarium sarcochroum]|uniref:BZIP domain-containing protein n=1 Tax=Fusarium sarcochroum TaxID=1208366 RepID=A0A8H4X2V6_9HYPO|nr:hypothetical protein FSARC_10904 [Fusarium sarcochroum]
MFLEEIPEPANKRSRSGRSNSPRAVQRRRLSQRNHRRRAKETSEASKNQQNETDIVPMEMSDNNTIQQPGRNVDQTQNLYYPPGSYHEPLQYASSSSNSTDYLEPQHFTGGQSNSAPTTSYAGLEMHNLITPDDMASLFSQDQKWLQADLERLSAPADSTMTRPISQATCSCRSSSERAFPQGLDGLSPGRRAEHGPDACSMPSAPSLSDLHSNRLCSLSADQHTHTGLRGDGPRPGMHATATGMSHSTLQGHASKPPTPSKGISPSPAEATNMTGHSAMADLTRRFESVLETMRLSGFHNFDEMAVDYYTGQFGKGSVPAIMQCSSRSRRLKVMLQKLQENSNEWPRWESRGLHESISTATDVIFC